MRRLRKNEFIRKMVQETKLSVDKLIMPLFVVEGRNIKNPIPSMPGFFQFSIDQLLEKIDEIVRLNISAIILFGIPDKKDEVGSGAYAEDGVIQRAVAAIKKHAPELLIITDICLCEYTSHGHCGVVKEGIIDNDETLRLLAKVALSHAEAGTDMVAPSDMMDGRVACIRSALDENGFKDIPILSYAAKYASSFYSPFREAAKSAPAFGDRKSYQIDPSNLREALREIELDIQEGADIVMVKPALAYLDVITKIKERFNHPVAAYSVSGEYAMIKAAAINKWINEQDVVLEILTAIKRAGADLIITYWACDVARWLRHGYEK
jgi:porphobilinogen synthase